LRSNYKPNGGIKIKVFNFIRLAFKRIFLKHRLTFFPTRNLSLFDQWMKYSGLLVIVKYKTNLLILQISVGVPVNQKKCTNSTLHTYFNWVNTSCFFVEKRPVFQNTFLKKQQQKTILCAVQYTLYSYISRSVAEGIL